ncbi:Xylose operon regulatory protein [Anaerohalosphaera lusitana]|uniref:Xylose operon regulatory protein n=2 Tax=Anaerohalosphaera lusitana TaxID=1936003 RepID=A0A1U9NNA0_9BACT|nr:Xylose operon regulatory protein [Anaerohalosphaera lusitana]
MVDSSYAHNCDLIMQSYPYVLVLLESSREYGCGLLRGIATYSSLYGPWNLEREIPFYLANENSSEDNDPCRWVADGIITRDTTRARQLNRSLTPVIFASYMEEHTESAARLMTNDQSVGKMGAKHFLERGFRSFGYVGYKNMFWSTKRGVSFCEELQRNGFAAECYSQSAKDSGSDMLKEQLVLADWLKSLEKPCGVFCCNDDQAQQVVRASRHADLRIPEDIGVLGVDNDEIICTLANPSISSIALNLEAAGFQAAQLLDQMMSGEQVPPETIRVEPSYVVTRQSSDISAIQDADVAAAVSFIRRNCRKPIQVDDVLQAVSVSRRCLYEKFKRELKCGVYAFIKKKRVEQIERRLIETDMSICQIALEFGFTSTDYIAQYFRSQKGVNPLEFRKQFGSSM